MKKVIFVCLLTLSVCLSQPAGEQATQSPTPSVATTKAAGVPQAPPGAPTQTPAGGPTPAPAGQIQTSTPAPSNAPVDPNSPTPKPTEQGKPSTDAATTVTPTVPTKLTTVNDTIITPSTPPTTPITTTTTTTTTTEKPTDHKAAATTVPTLKARGFDGASFVGGMILTLGIIAVGFLGYRYYKTQTERNYHTL